MNNDPKFRAIPKLETFKIPFKLEEASLVDWLIKLNHCDGREACSQTLAVLQALNKTEISSKNRLVFLTLINEYVKQYINHLDGQCWDSGFPLSIEENVYAEMITWNYLTLGQGFFRVAETASKKNDIIFALAMVLHALGQAQLHIAATYSIPNDGFWSLLYQTFSWAEQRNLQHLPIGSNDFSSLTLHTLFARSIVFPICDTDQFQPRDTRTVFNFLSKVCVDLPIVHHSSEPGLFMVDLKSDNPPLNVKKQIELGSDLIRYFSPVRVAKTLNHTIKHENPWNGTLKSINNALFLRVVKTLEIEHQRKYERTKEGFSLFGVIGFENIIGFLYKISKNAREKPNQKHKKTSQEISTANPNLTEHELRLLAKTEEHPVKQKAALQSHKQVWNQTDSTANITVIPNVSLKKLKVYDYSTNGYSVSWDSPPSKGKIGDLVGIVSVDRKRLEIAIIRRIAFSSGDIIRRIAMNTGSDVSNILGNDFRFGAEVVGFESEIVYLSSLQDEEIVAWAVLIPGIEVFKRPDTLIYTIGKFKVGETIQIQRGDTIMQGLLLTELYSTMAISHVELADLKLK